MEMLECNVFTIFFFGCHSTVNTICAAETPKESIATYFSRELMAITCIHVLLFSNARPYSHKLLSPNPARTVSFTYHIMRECALAHTQTRVRFGTKERAWELRHNGVI